MGFSVFNGKEFSNHTTREGLSDNTCYFIFKEQDNYFIGTNRGLNRFDGKNFKVYSAINGLAGTELNTGAFITDNTGRIWIGTNSGISIFKPGIIYEYYTEPPIYISGFKVSGRDTLYESGVNLKYNENHITFEYIGINFTSPEELTYEYILEGTQDSWFRTKARTLEFVLNPGEYTFKIKAINNDGIPSRTPAEIKFAILPPFYKTAWFIISGIFVLAFLVTVIILRYKKRNIILEKKVEKRTAELEQKITELSESKEHIHKLEELLPICSNCKKIRLEENNRTVKNWISIEKYLVQHAKKDVTHGICPECKKILYPELGEPKSTKKK